MANVYVARKRLRVGNRVYNPGDEVPEANTWRHLPVYVHNGSLALVQTNVHYRTGSQQRRPNSPGRDNWRKQRKFWYGEVQYGGGTPPGPTITGCTPTTVRAPSSTTQWGNTPVTFTGTHLDPTADHVLVRVQATDGAMVNDQSSWPTQGATSWSGTVSLQASTVFVPSYPIALAIQISTDMGATWKNAYALTGTP